MTHTNTYLRLLTLLSREYAGGSLCSRMASAGLWLVLLAGLALPLNTWGQCFGVPQTYGVGSYPESIVTSDVNADGKPDLITANNGDNTVSVLLGNGDGTFQTQQPYAVGGDPLTVAVGDINADGKPDLFTANFTNPTVSVLLGNGDGTFQTQKTYAVGSYPRSVAVGDVNADGKPDLVAANGADNTVSVLLGNGDGTFQTQKTYAASNSPYSVLLSDVNADGKPDLIVANAYSNKVSVLLGNGDGTFQALKTYATGSTPYSVVLSDVNADGKPDLIAANANGNTVSVLLGNGDGTFQTQKTYALESGSYPTSVVASDVNADGKPDLITANNGNDDGNTVSVLLGNGDGTFQTPKPYTVGDGPYAVVAIDVNADGRPDLVTANGKPNTVSVLINCSGPAPIISVQGNSTTIANGDTNPSTADNTDFGPVAPGSSTTATFTIQNLSTASAPLSVSGISFSGTNSNEFSLISPPSFPLTIAIGASQTFTVQFAPTSSGLHTAVVNITNNQLDATPYTFAVQGGIRPPGAALNFDGADDYVSLPTALLGGRSQATFEAWVNTSINSNYPMIFGTTSGNFEVALLNSANLYVRCRSSSSSDIYGSTTSSPFATTGQWTHVAVVFDGSQSGNANRLKLYLNGMQQTLSFNSGNTVPATLPNEALFLGTTTTNNSVTYWNGSLDEVRVWNVARTQAQLQASYQCELSGTTPGLVAYYNFNEGNAALTNTGVTSLTDASSNGYNGTLTNFALSGTTSNWITPGGVATGNSCGGSPTLLAGTATGIATACVGTASSSQSFTVSGSSLTAGIVVQAPASFEVSTSATTGFASSLTLAQAGGTVASTTLYVRTTATATTGTQTGSLTLTSAGATSQTVAVTATVNAPPTVTIAATPSLTITSGNSITLTASGATSYTWSNGSTANPLLLTNVTSATTLSVTGTSGTCSATASVAISVTQAANPCLFVPQNITVSGFKDLGPYTFNPAIFNQVFTPGPKQNSAPTWSVSTPSSATIVWSSTSSRWEIKASSGTLAYNTTGSITNLPGNNWTDNTGGYFGTPTLSGGVGSLAGGPSVSISPSSQTITLGSSATLTASGATSYVWSNGSTANPLVLSNVTSATTLSVTGTTGVCSATASAAVSVTSSPLAVTATASQYTVCANVPFLVSFTVTGGQPPYDYMWNQPDAATTTGDGNTTTAVIGTRGLGEQTFEVIITDANNTVVSSNVVSVTVVAPPTLSITATPSFTITSGQSASLTASGATSYTWNTGQTTASISATTAGAYSVTGTTTAGCSATATANVTQTTLLGPDLTANLTLPDGTFPNTPGAAKDLVMSLFEVGGLPTSAGNITITLTAPLGYTLVFDQSLTSINVSGGNTTAVDNANWQISNNQNGQQLSLTIKAGQLIPANGKSVVGFSVVRTSANAGSVANLTVNINDDAGKTYDRNSGNNIYVRILNGL